MQSVTHSSAGTTETSIATAQKAWALLQGEEFRESWDQLFYACPWATAFQSSGFVSAWYETYRERFDPVLVTQRSAQDGLVGLLTLAVSQDRKRLIVAGGHQAEYQSWLAYPDYGESFPPEALSALDSHFPEVTLVLKYLPPATPIAWVEAGTRERSRCLLEGFMRPVVRLGDAPGVAEYLREKYKRRSTKNYLNRLSRMGKLKFEKLTDPSQVESVAQEIFDAYDLRQGAAHDATPFWDDPLKFAFHMALLRKPGLAHVTVLWLDSKVVAAHFGLHDRTTVYLCVPAYSPFYGKTRAFTLHMLMLIEKVSHEGFETLDLTPGGEHKERFATAHEDVHVLTVFASSKQAFRRKLNVRAAESVKSALRHTPKADKLLRDLSRGIEGLRAAPGRVLARRLHGVVRSVWSQAEVRIYELRGEQSHNHNDPRPLAVNSLQDLLAYQCGGPFVDRRSFLEQALTYLEEGAHVYTLTEKGRLLHHCWVLRQPGKILFSAVAQELQLPARAALIFDSYTQPAARGQGYEDESLRQMLQDLKAVPDLKQIYAAIAPWSRSFVPALERSNFVYRGSLFNEVRLGKLKLWSDPQLAPLAPAARLASPARQGDSG